MSAKSTLTVFLVDNDRTYLRLQEERLQSLGVSHIYLFQNYTECIEQLYLQPDLILMQDEPQTMKGIAALREIKAYNSQVLVVFMAAEKRISAAVNALKCGAFDYIIKGHLTQGKLKSILDKTTEIVEVFEKQRRRMKMKKMLSSASVASLLLLMQRLGVKA